MKIFVSLIALCGMLLMADVASASGYGAAVVQQNIVIRQRQRIQPLRSFRQSFRQRIRVEQVVAPVYAQAVVAPVYAAPVVQSYVVPQQVVVPYVQQQVVVPQVQNYVAPLQGGCALGISGGCNMF